MIRVLKKRKPRESWKSSLKIWVRMMKPLSELKILLAHSLLWIWTNEWIVISRKTGSVTQWAAGAVLEQLCQINLPLNCHRKLRIIPSEPWPPNPGEHTCVQHSQSLSEFNIFRYFIFFSFYSELKEFSVIPVPSSCCDKVKGPAMFHLALLSPNQS